MNNNLPPLPFAVFDEFGDECEDQVADHYRAALAAQPVAQAPVWQSIRSAPKDGTHILAMLPDRDTCYVICWVDASRGIRENLGDQVGWHIAYCGDFLQPHDEPTRWQPLPALASQDENKEQQG